VRNAGTFVVAMVLATLSARSQEGTSVGQAPVFDSITIRRNSQGFIDLGGGDRMVDGYIQCRGVDSEPGRADPLPKVGAGGCGARNATVKELINAAYQLRPAFPRSALNEIVTGGPPWAADAAFDIDARVNNAQAKTTHEFFVMLQNLLRDRFRLKFHRETRDVSGMALSVARNGHKLKPANFEQPEELTDLPSLKAQKVPVQALANLLSDHLGTFVVDQTNLVGSFNFSLEWTPTAAELMPPSPGAPSALPPTLVKAVEEQLGLHLEPLTTKWDVIVIDGLSQPSVN
jgi:uncharacterized protein (TIGR03435 family)